MACAKALLACAVLLFFYIALIDSYSGYWIQINNHTYRFTNVELNQSEWEQGLMNATVTNNTLVLFYFGRPGVWDFWMKNTYSPLDMIWIDGNTVVYIANAVPCVSYDPDQQSCQLYMPNTVADAVIEAPAGFAARNNLHVGEAVELHLPPFQ